MTRLRRFAASARPAFAWLRRGRLLAALAILAAGAILSGADAPGPQFTDVTAKANVAFTHVNGASPDKHLPETIGSGAAFVDLDGDGWVDIVLVDGGSIADPQVSRRAQPRVLPNRPDGTVEDGTAPSRIPHD